MTWYTLLGVALIVLVGYGFIKAWPLIMGPTLSVVSPADNATLVDGIVYVEGRVKRAVSIRINGSPILHDQNGDFSSTLTFPSGGSILTFTVTDRFGREVTETRTVYVPMANSQLKINN